MRRSIVLTIVLAAVVALSPATLITDTLSSSSADVAQARAASTCSSVWEQAQAVISTQCTENISDESVCYAYPTLMVNPPRLERFEFPGDIIPVQGLTHIWTAPLSSTDDWGGIAWFKLIARTPLPGFTIGQAVIFIAFGDTTVSNLQDSPNDVALSEGDCTAFIKPGATRYEGSYLRALPDPQFQYECRDRTGNCADNDNLLRLVPEGAPFEVLAMRSSGRDAVLARDPYVTGWITASEKYIDLSACDLDSLPELSDGDLLESLDTTTELSALTAFHLVRGSSGMECPDTPSDGLLVIDPTGQRIRFTVNGVTIEMASTVFIRGDDQFPPRGISALVLQGSATVTKNGVSVTATAGQQVDAFGEAPVVTSGGSTGNWCQQLTGIARAAFPGVPIERIDYCQSAPPPVSTTTWYVTAIPSANARECASTATCAIIERFACGATVSGVEEVQGDPVNGNTRWQRITYGDRQLYMHNSVLSSSPPRTCSPIPTPPPPRPPEPPSQLPTSTPPPTEPIPPPTADFSSALIEGVCYQAQFTNLSTNADSYLWQFGDGATSTEVNPQHTYDYNDGSPYGPLQVSFDVRLTAYGPGGQHTEVKQVIMDACFTIL